MVDWMVPVKSGHCPIPALTKIMVISTIVSAVFTTITDLTIRLLMLILDMVLTSQAQCLAMARETPQPVGWPQMQPSTSTNWSTTPLDSWHVGVHCTICSETPTKRTLMFNPTLGVLSHHGVSIPPIHVPRIPSSMTTMISWSSLQQAMKEAKVLNRLHLLQRQRMSSL